ncbi:alpha/beta fold hydrolase [Desulfococcus sp.]|uniref:alpha/beta fold hydrolase n=1 Tax=Desulfococcus sp. TaxID=2025834 RepID=UPI003594384B
MNWVMEHRLTPVGGRRLETVRVRVKSPRGLIFVPPLIGGDAAQQVRYFRRLIRMGYDFLSFSYPGHGRSTDRFSHAAAVRSTKALLRQVDRENRSDGLPMAGIACCYGAIPLIFGNSRLESPLKKLVLINAVFDLSARAALTSFLRYCREIHGRRGGLPPFRGLLQRYLDFMFPNVQKNRHAFGSLHRRRIRLFRTFMDVLFLEPLAAVRQHRTRALCLYGREDNILRLYGAGYPASYEETVRRIFPDVAFQPLPGDHFLSCPRTRDETLLQIRSFFER